MKATILLTVALLITTTLFAQAKFPSAPSTNVFISYDGTKFREVGLRYWFSEAFALFGNWSFVYSHVNSINQESDGSTVSLGGGGAFRDL